MSFIRLQNVPFQALLTCFFNPAVLRLVLAFANPDYYDRSDALPPQPQRQPSPTGGRLPRSLFDTLRRSLGSPVRPSAASDSVAVAAGLYLFSHCRFARDG
jgi:hypothetical protein